MIWETAARIETEVARIITQQEINGWKFDLPLALQHISYLDKECERLYDSIREGLGFDLYLGKTEVGKPFRKDGTLSQRVLKYWGEDSPLVWGPYHPVHYEYPTLTKRQRLIPILERLGWKPLEFTDTGNPSITEESLVSLRGTLGDSLARWWVYDKRRSTIQGLINKVRPDGRISAEATTNGTPTGRMRQRTVVNIPKAVPSVIFGKEIRELFIAEEGYALIGYDAKGLEARILAHYMNDPEFMKIVLTGDVHDYFQRKIGLSDRDITKTFEYAFFYGAQDTKLGTILGGSSRDGKEARGRLLGSVPRLGTLLRGVESAASKGYLTGLDGRRLPVRKTSAALNTLIQGGGAIAMKVIMVYLDKFNRNSGLDLSLCRKVGDFHDEGQHEIWNDEKYIELFKNNLVKAFTQTNKFLGLRCPLEGDIKIGPNWSVTH